ncbi:MAG: pyruvate kinase [Ardenticatenaceae bacterium]|nr:pyruvate kinase [Ardenticatenaceae bacterium]MCB9442887.1 pyruvate kinase [Ardenticatenaceae bacterium]
MKVTQLLPKKTKIVCTIGPASESQTVLEQMIASGMNIARINFAHGDFDGHRQVIANVRAAAKAIGCRVSIFGDLPGPKMRIGKLAKEPIFLEKGQPFILQAEPIVGDEQHVSMSFRELPHVVQPGDQIFLNDGYLQLEVKRVEDQAVHCQVVVGGELRSHKGINLPDINLGISAFTEDDAQYLKFAAEQQLDGVSQSFVESAADIEAVRQAAKVMNYDPLIIAKIERSRALTNLKSILEAADGIMVARGDLGVEIPIERIAGTQKWIIDQANLYGKPVITATQMLESMIDHNRPTRAEATDVANAILDGTDCVMLSAETAVGQFPVESVAVMSRIAHETESSSPIVGVANLLEVQQASGEITRNDLISFNIFQSAKTLNPDIVFVPSASGATARRVTRFRLPQWIVGICLDEKTCQRLQFMYGIYPVYIRANPISWPHFAQSWLAERQIDGDLVLVIEGGGTMKAGDTTRLDIIDLTR